MKNKLLVIIITILSYQGYAQITYEKGYYIKNNGEKIAGEIKNIDWKNNPTEFDFRLSENDESKIMTIKSVQEFGVNNYSKYIRATVKIDRSSNDLDDLSTERNPEFNEEELFLKVLVAGKSNLYQYEEGNFKRFFFSNNKLNKIEQLIYKSYRVGEDNIAENNGYQQQLLIHLKCDLIKLRDIKKTNYNKNELVKLFINYNECSNTEVTNFEEKGKKDLFNLSFRPRLNSSSLTIQNDGNYGQANFGNKFGFGFGIETEFILPFNKNKWSVNIEPSYQSFKSETQFINGSSVLDRNAKIDYQSVQLAVGLRYYFFLNKNAKIFMNGLYLRDFQLNSSIEFDSGVELEISTGQNFGFGIGYKQHDKYSLELRFQRSRGVLGRYQLWGSQYKTFSIIFGYSLF